MSAPITPYKAQRRSLLGKMNSIGIIKNKLAVCLVIISTTLFKEKIRDGIIHTTLFIV
jgi:hypothetical protein